MQHILTSPLVMALLKQETPGALYGGTEGPDLTRYLVVCGFLIAGILGLAWGFRRLFAGSLRARAGKRHLAVLDVLPLGKGRQISVVRCFDRTFALGLGEKHVSLIAELDAIVGEEQVRGQEGAVDLQDFNRLLETTAVRRPVSRPAAPAFPLPGEGVVA